MPAGGDGEARAGGDDLGPLSGGHHGLSPQQVAESQRERLLAAVAQLVAERGYRAMTITEIAKTASVANRVFYDNFANKEEAFLAAFDAVAAHLRGLIEAELPKAADWPSGVIAVLRTTLAFFAAEPQLGRLCLVAPLTATPATAAHFRATIDVALPLLEAGRAERDDGSQLPPSTEDSLLGGAITQISRRLINEEPLEDLLPDLASFLLAPYLGSEDAKRLALADGISSK